MEAFLADKSKLDRARELLKSEGLTDEQKKVLGMFERTFKCYIMESDEAKKLREESMKIEGSLEAARNTMKLGADLPGQGFTELSSVGLRNKMRTDNDEAVRKAAYNGLRTIGPFVLENVRTSHPSTIVLNHPCALSLYYDGEPCHFSPLALVFPVRVPRLIQCLAVANRGLWKSSRRATRWPRASGMWTTTITR